MVGGGLLCISAERIDIRRENCFRGLKKYIYVYMLKIYILLTTTTVLIAAAVSLISTPRVDPFSKKEPPKGNPKSKIAPAILGCVSYLLCVVRVHDQV